MYKFLNPLYSLLTSFKILFTFLISDDVQFKFIKVDKKISVIIIEQNLFDGIDRNVVMFSKST